MTRDDWLCLKCGALMRLNVWRDHILCYECCEGKMRMAWGVMDLPKAVRINDKSYWIPGYEIAFEYVLHGHATALDKAPQEGDVVASVAFRGRRAARLFRKKKSRSR